MSIRAKGRAMALRRTQPLSRLAIAVAAFAILVASFASARAPKDNPSQQSLLTEVGEAVKAGDSGRGILPAQQALRLARQAFGNRDPRTLPSLSL